MTTRRHTENAVSFPRRPGVSRAGDAAFRPLPSSRSGSALVFAIGCFFFLFVLVLSVYSVGETIRRKTELQNACDAAAYSAAVVQADILSRMAVLNRAMAWSYIQTTKMQMDYIAYKWLRHVRDCFEEDMKNIRPTGMAEFGKPGMGYHHLREEFQEYDPDGQWMAFHFDCHDGVHDNPDDSRARYIGLGPNTEGGLNALGTLAGALAGGKVHPRDHHWIRINGFPATERRLQYDESSGDLVYVENGKPKRSRLVGALEDAFGPNGENAAKAIGDAKQSVEYCNGMLPVLASSMSEAMTVAAEKALKANLPRRPDGTVDPKALADYVWAFSPGVSAGLPYPGDAGDGYFDPLYNREEDEIRFLSMANGLPADDDNVKLKDFFRSGSEGGGLAAGLDQWFVRANPDELDRDKVGVYRDWMHSPAGIQRCYKTANYAEGAVSGFLRGNYCLDGDSPKSPQTPSDVGNVSMFYLSNAFNPGPSGSWRQKLRLIRKALREYRRVRSNFNGLKGYLRELWSQVPFVPFSRFSQNAGPSCINHRSRFHDQCANVNDTVGLVAEYEWAAAYWFCFWIEFRMHPNMGGLLMPLNNGHQPFCVHIPIPSAVFGGWNRAAGYSGGDPATIAGTQDKMFRPSQDKDPQLGGTTLRGWKRSEYRRTFIGADGEPRYGCPLHLEDDNGANMGAKGYVRIYGDDKDIKNACYVGPNARPYVLNQRYFNGAGTTIVGVARRQRNVFHWIEGKLGRALGLYDAFSPDIRVKDKEGMIVRDKDGNDQSAGAPHLVVFSAARAAWAPRSGRGVGEGTDSENDPVRGKWGGRWGRHYELRYDTVTDGEEGNFTPHLHPNAPNGESLSKEARLGCPCGQPETGRRLRRQWNLCQTDWDAVLLPVRHSLAVPSRVAGSSPASAPADFDSGDDPDALANWAFTDEVSDTDPQYRLFGPTLPNRETTTVPNMTWQRFSEDGSTTDAKYEDVVLKPQNMSVNDAYLLFKKRMIH